MIGRLPSRQDGLLDTLRPQGEQIPELSQLQHDILQDLHPNVKRIHDTVTDVADEIEDVQCQTNRGRQEHVHSGGPWDGTVRSAPVR